VKNVAGIALIALVLVGSLLAYRWWTSPERQIRRVLAGVAGGLSHDTPTSALGAAAAASALQSYFAPDVTVELTRPTTVLKGRDHVLATAVRLRAFMPAMRVEFVDQQITVAADNQSADVDCTAMATLQDRAGQESVDAREVIISLRNVDGRWVISHGRAVEVLEPLTP
jgi:SnoaL-like domain